MAIEIEDGTAKADAEAYISVADADAYFTARGNTAWGALDTSAKEQALRKAADYMEGAYAQRWKGVKYTEAQALSWPRSGAYQDGFLIDADTVPVAVQRANAELAVRASADDLLADQEPRIKQETIGPISTTYADGARQSTFYAQVEAMLSGLLRGSGQVPVVRA